MDFILPFWGYVPALAWLVYVTASGLGGHRVPTGVMVTAAAVAALFNIMMFGIVAATATVLVTSVVFLALSLSGVASRSTTVALIPAMASLPIPAWIAFIPGLILAAVLAYLRLRKVAGDGYLNMLAGETLASMGNRAGSLAKPDLSRLRRAEEAGGFSDVRIRFAAVLLVGVAAAAFVSLIY